MTDKDRSPIQLENLIEAIDVKIILLPVILLLND